ncbi:CelD/BcsL family acetyltransferase involved in cellulose biosynthesis [Methylocaldum szegediense]|uniref:CelD/BcsL family acetyltransferase involved in cellulose biosynthesis n=1 Tax=Methylocaldum szegediense TaxID=73780 RepID=A0ABN8X1U6_9GAMM|nr:CelD/BcsL family acetyltransferase involved in cellulose biosynthesis [Methylocaldum szegediense]
MRSISEKVSIKTFRGLSGLDEIATEWEFITKLMDRKRFFYLADWYRCYLETLEEEPDKVLFTIVYIGDKPEAIFPLKISARRILGLRMKVLELPSHPHMCLNDFIVARPAYVKSYVPLVLKHLKEVEGLSWDYIYLPRVLEESTAAIALVEQSDTLSVKRSCGCCNYLVIRPYSAMFQGFSRNFRSCMRRAKKRAEELGNIHYTTASTYPELETAYGAFLEVEASGWKGKNGIGTAIKLNKRLELFYRRVMERYSRLGGCEIHIMWHEEKPISVEFSLVIDGTLYTMKIGYDENYSFCSPGHLLREYIINYHEQKGDISFNNLITEAGWHHGWRPQSYNLFHYYLCSPSIRGRIAYMYQKALLKIRPVWLVLKPKLRNWNIIPGRPVRV